VASECTIYAILNFTKELALVDVVLLIMEKRKLYFIFITKILNILLKLAMVSLFLCVP